MKTNFIIITVLLCLLGCGGDSDSSIRYVAIGASDATGIGAKPITKGYVYIIDEELPKRVGQGVELINLGIPGIEVNDFVNIELPLAKEANPDLVTI